MPLPAGINDVAVIIPAYNAGAVLGQVLSQTLTIIPPQQVIVINDGSTDATGECAEQYRVSVIRHQENRGKGAALKSGFKAVLARPEIQAVITMDADGQHGPNHLPEFIRVFRKSSVDLIIGCRQLRWPPMPFFRIMSNRITSALVSRRLGIRIPDSQSGFRLHSRRLLQHVKLQTDGYEMESELLIQAASAGMRIDFIPIATIYSGQQSHIHGWRDIRRFIQMWFNQNMKR